MRNRYLRAVRAVLIALTVMLTLSDTPLFAQEPAAPAAPAAQAPATSGPRLPDQMRRAEPDYSHAARFAPKKKEEMTTITISTVALVLILILIIVLVA